MLSLFMTACSSDDYDWATVSGNQVYFSSELDSIMEISTKATTFEVPISRVNADEAISVPLKAEQEAGSIFTVPSNVEFKAGEKTAKVAISYDPSKITFGKYEKMTLSLLQMTATQQNMATVPSPSRLVPHSGLIGLHSTLLVLLHLKCLCSGKVMMLV